jgi:hypothetical protein
MIRFLEAGAIVEQKSCDWYLIIQYCTHERSITFARIVKQRRFVHTRPVRNQVPGCLQFVMRSGGGPACGTYDLTFALWNAASAGSQIGSTITDTGQSVTNGLFTVVLDFGGVFNGTSYWLEIGVRTNGAVSFTRAASNTCRAPKAIMPSISLINGKRRQLGLCQLIRAERNICEKTFDKFRDRW